jgi:hypothetical protein
MGRFFTQHVDQESLIEKSGKNLWIDSHSEGYRKAFRDAKNYFEEKKPRFFPKSIKI